MHTTLSHASFEPGRPEHDETYHSGQGYLSCCGRSLRISYQDALEPTNMCPRFEGRRV